MLLLVNIVFLFVTILGMLIIFYFGYKILQADWRSNTKVIMLLLLILGTLAIAMVIAFSIINFWGLDRTQFLGLNNTQLMVGGQ